MLEMREITKAYQGRQKVEVLDGVSLQLEKGKTDQTEIVGKAAYEQYGYGYPDEHIYIDSQAS